MKCVIPGRGIKAFGKSIYCLAKIGEELYIEAMEDGLALKTVNSARSAYACFLFQRTFFHSYRDGRRRGREAGLRGEARDEEEEDNGLKCKILAKSILTVFRALTTLERTVDHCTLNLDLEENKLIFVFHCKHGIVKTHSLGYQECEALQAVFTKELCPNHITTPAKVLSEVVTHFPVSLEEVTLIANPSCVKLKNYVEDDGDGTRVALTEISLAPGEFDQYQIGVDAAITFCLKEMRAILIFTDAINHCLSLRFEAPGRPVVFSIENCNEYRADFVLATLLDATSPSQRPSTVQSSINASTTAPTTQSRAQSKNGFGNHLGTNSTMSLDDLDLTELNDTASDTRALSRREGHATHKKKTNSVSSVTNKRGNQTSSNPSRTTNQEFDFPTGSQFTRANKVTQNTQPDSNIGSKDGRSSQIASESHVPAPPDDLGLDFVDMDMDIDMDDYGRQPIARQREAREDKEGPALMSEVYPSTGRNATSLSTRVTSDNFDVMDAIFGDENLNDVADDGNQFGFGIENQYDQRQVKGQNNSSCKGKESEKSKRIGKKMLTKQVHQVTKPVLPRLETEESLTQMENQEATTQDSVINDSGFLTSTPPAKKHKPTPYSVLFGMDMFTHDHESEDLAPDSDSDG